jgi:hypothetical protein
LGHILFAVRIVTCLTPFFQSRVHGLPIGHLIVALPTASGRGVRKQPRTQLLVRIVAGAALVQLFPVTTVQHLGVAPHAQLARCGSEQTGHCPVGIVTEGTSTILPSRRVNPAFACAFIVTTVAKTWQRLVEGVGVAGVVGIVTGRAAAFLKGRMDVVPDNVPLVAR